ncbi:MAG: zf-HC2 domain-containing protein [Acidobacteriota bacterium]
MTCLRENNQGADLLIGYLEGTLASDQRRELESHASACADCRGLLAVQVTLGEYQVPGISADFDARLYARIAREEARPWWSPASWNLSWKLMAPMTAAAAMLAVGLYVDQPVAQPLEDGQKQASVDHDVLQLEQALEQMELLMPLEGSASSL